MKGLVFALALAVLSGGYCSYVAVRRQQVVDLPVPHGPYAVGRTISDWTDASRIDPFAPTAASPRVLSVWLWYPAAAATTGMPAGYAPGAWQKLHLQAPASLFEGPFDRVREHARVEVPAAEGPFPLVVLMPGLGFSAQQYTVLAEDLASRGYVVAGLTPTYSANVTVLNDRVLPSTSSGNPSDIGAHTGRAAANAERLIGVWADDARFVAATATNPTAARLTGHVDPRGVVYVGHSFGGAASLQACASDPRCAGAVDIDGTQFGPVIHHGLRTPFMILGSEASCVTGSCEAHSRGDRADRDAARALIAASTAPHWCYTVTGTMHLNFTDDAVLYLAPPIRNLFALGGINGRRGLLIQNDLVAAFLDQALRQQGPALVARAAAGYSEIRPEKR